MGRRASAWAASVAALALAGGAAADQKVALFVGVGKYDKPGFADVPGAENDSRALTAEFTKLGFQTHTMTAAPGPDRATGANLRAKVEELIAPLGKDDVLILGLAGHGQQLETTDPGAAPKVHDYFCPVDATTGAPDTLVRLDRLIDRAARNVGTVLVVIDACRNTPDDPTRGGRGVGGGGVLFRSGGIAGRALSLPPGVSVLFSCGEGQRSVEHPKRDNGLFTAAILEELRATPGEVEWLTLASKVASRMAGSEYMSLLPSGVRQSPVLACNVGRAVLGRPGEPNSYEPPAEFAWRLEVGKPFFLYGSQDAIWEADLTDVPAVGRKLWRRNFKTAVTRFIPLGRDAQGGWVLSARIDGFKVIYQTAEGDRDEWDSYSGQPAPERFAILPPFIGGEYRVRFDRDLRFKEALDLDALAARIPGVGAEPEAVAAFKESFVKVFRSTMNELFGVLPGRPVKAGDGWRNQLHAPTEFGDLDLTALYRAGAAERRGEAIAISIEDFRFHQAKTMPVPEMTAASLGLNRYRGNAYYERDRGRAAYIDMFFELAGNLRVAPAGEPARDVPIRFDYGAINQILDRDPFRTNDG